MFQSLCFNHQFLHYYPWESVHIYHDGRDHFVTTTSVGGNVKIFDSLNLSPSSDLIKQIRVLYSPDITITPTVLKAELRSIQLSSKDCGLFAIAYAVEIAYGNDPAKFIFKQSDMRQHLHNCLTSKSMSVFPKVRELHTDSVFKDITSDYQIKKWESPSKPIKYLIKKSPPDFITQNRFMSLASGIPTSQSPSSEPSDTSKPKIQAPKHLSSATKSLISNLSNRSISETEKTVLELGLTFCPSQKNLNKEQLTLDFYHFIRPLKLKEYFHFNPPHNNQDNPENHVTTDDERSNLNWSNKNSDWYPDSVKHDRSEGLLKFINKVTKDLKDHLKNNENKFWNNLDNDQRKALLDLANDPSITIKPADKGGLIVIMNTDDYVKSCLNSLSDPNFYEELPADPNPKYRTDLDQKIDDLLSSNIINEFEASKLQCGSRTPYFYGLPKIHNSCCRFGSIISPYVPLGHQSGSALWLQLCNIWAS